MEFFPGSLYKSKCEVAFTKNIFIRKNKFYKNTRLNFDFKTPIFMHIGTTYQDYIFPPETDGEYLPILYQVFLFENKFFLFEKPDFIPLSGI